MAWAWYGKMKLLAGVGKYQPYWTSPCEGGETVDGKMELAGGKLKPLPDAYGICSAEELSNLDRYMYLDEGAGKYKPHVVLDSEEMCCPGGNCYGCVPDLWPDGETPKYVLATITGISECSGQCAASYTNFNGTWTLTQDTRSGQECWWWYTDYESDPNVFMRWGTHYGSPANSWFHIWTNDNAGDVDAYYAASNVLCSTSFTDGFHITACCSGNVWWGIGGVGGDPQGEIVAYGGNVNISWPV